MLVTTTERLFQVARNEGIETQATFYLNYEIERLFGEDRTIIREAQTSTGLWQVSLSDKEPAVDVVVFEKATPIKLPEIPSSQLLINRVKVGIGLRTVRAITETEARLFSDNEDTNKYIGARNTLGFLSLNPIKVEDGFEVNPELLYFYPTPRSSEHVAQVLSGATLVLRTIK